jgi:hypothetical protein
MSAIPIPDPPAAAVPGMKRVRRHKWLTWPVILGAVLGGAVGALAVSLIVYGLLASVLPVWLLLAPRGYLSTFVKLGVVVLLAAGILFLRPELKLPAFTRFVDGTGPIFAGNIFDMGADATAKAFLGRSPDFFNTRATLPKRPWRIDD